MSEHSHNHNHNHGHHHHHFGAGKNIYWAVTVNILLTVIQIAVGLFSGSLSLIADGVHNLSDAGSLMIAAFAKKISGRPANQVMTFGFGRAEILGALINSTTLLVVAVYLVIEAINRFNDQDSIIIDGRWVMSVAIIAIIIDVLTAMLLFKESKDSINIKAAFIHNVSDALASVVVLISGVLIYFFKIQWFDLVATILIAIYTAYHSYVLLKDGILVLMQAVPGDLNVQEIREEIYKISQISEVHHIHIWQIHERFRSFEGHLVLDQIHLSEMENIKQQVKQLLKEKFKIHHSTLEFEVKTLTQCKSH